MGRVSCPRWRDILICTRIVPSGKEGTGELATDQTVTGERTKCVYAYSSEQQKEPSRGENCVLWGV